MDSLHVTVAAVVEQDGRFLLVEERIGSQQVFNQPAGHVEAGEPLLAAVVREAREETAWHFEPQALVGIYLWRAPQDDSRFLRFAFCGTVRDHDAAQPLDRGIVRTHWLTLAQLDAYRTRLRSPLVLRCLEDYRAGARNPLTRVNALDRDLAALSLSANGRSCAAGPVTVVP
jgi:8-oxo-dGTP pyrophosphatase MutT (NUDIX family)